MGEQTAYYECFIEVFNEWVSSRNLMYLSVTWIKRTLLIKKSSY
jgi:hypothetical protein